MGANIEGLFRTDVYELPITAIREMIASALSNLENKIIELLKVIPDATTKEIVKKLEITDNQVKYYIKKLKDDDKIERIVTNRKGSWREKLQETDVMIYL